MEIHHVGVLLPKSSLCVINFLFYIEFFNALDVIGY